MSTTEWGAPPDLLMVVDPKGAPEACLDRMAPDSRGSGYATRLQGPVGVRHRVSGPMAPKVAAVDGTQAFLLGQVVSEEPEVDGAALGIVRRLSAGDYRGLARTQGVFALVAIDWPAGRVRLMSDLMGVRPIFWTARDGVVAVADRALAAARLDEVRLAPRGTAAWMAFNCALAEDTLFQGVQRAPPASVGDIQTGAIGWQAYWKPTPAEVPIDEDRLWEQVYEDFRASVTRLLAPYESATVLVSGGYDSRFALLTALRHTKTRLHLATVPYNEGERRVAAELLRLARLPSTRVDVRGAMLDAFDMPWHAHPEGYVLSRNLTHLAVVERALPGPFLDGWMGSGLFRPRTVPEDFHRAAPEEALDLVWRRNAAASVEFLLTGPVRQRLRDLAREALALQMEPFCPTSKPCLLWDLYVWQGRFISNGFIQWQHRAESLHPFFDRALLERRLGHPHRLFRREGYRRLLAERFPSLGALPHAQDLGRRGELHSLVSRRLQRSLPRLASFVVRHRSVFRTRWILPRLSAYGLGSRKQAYVVAALARLEALWQYLKTQGVDFTYAEVLGR